MASDEVSSPVATTILEDRGWPVAARLSAQTLSWSMLSGGWQGNGNVDSQDRIRTRVLKADGLTLSRRFNADEVVAAAACPLPPAAALGATSWELGDARGVDPSQRGLCVGSREEGGRAPRGLCNSISVACELRQRLQQPKQAVWAFGRESCTIVKITVVERPRTLSHPTSSLQVTFKHSDWGMAPAWSALWHLGVKDDHWTHSSFLRVALGGKLPMTSQFISGYRGW